MCPIFYLLKGDYMLYSFLGLFVGCLCMEVPRSLALFGSSGIYGYYKGSVGSLLGTLYRSA